MLLCLAGISIDYQGDASTIGTRTPFRIMCY